jgi:hypothetical protein
MKGILGPSVPPRPIPNYNLNRQVGVPWIDCLICGFSIPRSEAVKHYKKGALVCLQCADVEGHTDAMERTFPDANEGLDRTPQKVIS